MTNPELSHIVTLADAMQGRKVALDADEVTRAAIAKRLGLIALDRFVVEAEVFAVAGGITARGSITADVVQACAATDLPVPAHIADPFDLRFLRDIGADASEEEEVEISADDLAAIERALQTIAIVGDRYPAHLQQRVDR